MRTADPLSAVEVHMVAATVSARAGGLTAVLLERVRALARARTRTTLLVLGYRHYETPEAWRLAATRVLPWRTRRRYFWREAPDLLAGPPGPASSGGRGPRFAPPPGTVPRTRRDVLGRPRAVEHVGPDGRPVARELRAVSGRAVLVDHLDPRTGRAVRRDHLDDDARCWLSVTPATWSSTATARLHTTTGTCEQPLAEVYARWIDLVTAGRPAVVLCDGEVAAGIPAALTGSRTRAVSVLHNPHTRTPADPSSPTAPGWEAALRRAGAVTRVVVLTEAHRRDLLTRYGPPAPTVVRNAVPPVGRRPQARDPLRVVTVGRLVGRKRVGDVLRAFAAAAEHVPGARLEVVGDGPARARLEDLAGSLGLHGRVTFHGFVRRPGRIVSTASFGVLTSTYEGMGLVIAEGMSVGTPFVAYDVPYGPADVITPGVDGLLVPGGDLDGLTAALRQLLVDPARADAMREPARRTARTRFGRDRFADEWLRVLREEAAALTDPVT